MSAGSPPLHEVIGQIPDIGMLQDITLHLDAGLASSLGYHRHSLVRFAPKLIRCFAGLECNGPRQRCVVEIVFVSDFDFALGLLDMVMDCGHGMGRLTGFKYVELRMGYLHKTMERMEFLVRTYTHLNGDLAVTLGEGKLLDDERDVCWTYRPRQVSEVVAVPRERRAR